MKLKCIFFFISFCVNVLVFAQTPSFQKRAISASWFSYLVQKQEITPSFDKRPDANVSSIGIVTYAAKVDYRIMLNERLEMSIGALSGAYPYAFHISFDSSFAIFDRNFDEYTFDRYSRNYIGLDIGVQYFVKLAEKHHVSACLNINYVLFIPQYVYNFAYIDQSDKGTFTFFTSSFEGKGDKGFIAPEFSIGYYYKLSKYFTPFISFNGVYSNYYPIKGVGFRLQGKNETLRGNFRGRFAHAGIEVGVKVNLPERKKTK